MNDYILCLSGIKTPPDGIRRDFPISILFLVTIGFFASGWSTFASGRSVTLLWQSPDVLGVFDRMVLECRHE
jgi:hypothetical protein